MYLICNLSNLKQQMSAVFMNKYRFFPLPFLLFLLDLLLGNLAINNMKTTPDSQSKNLPLPC